MPFYKKKFVRYRGKRRYGRGGTRKIARIAQAVVNKNIETKEKKYDYSSVGIDPVNGTAVSLSSVSYGSSTIIAQLCRGITSGTGEGFRVGHQITLRGVYVNLAIQCASGTESNNFRILVVRPKGQISTTTVSGLAQQIFSNAGSSSTQWLNPVDTDIYKVYMDRKFWLMPKDISGVGNVTEKFCTRFLKFGKKGLNMQWNEADSQPYRDLMVVCISDSGAVSHPGAIAGFIKLYYKDG